MKNEYEQRLAGVRADMQNLGLDVLLTADPANMHYLSGYDGWSFYVPQCLIIGAQDDTPPFWWGRGIDAAGAKRTVWMGDEHLFSYGDEYVHNPPRHAGEHLAKTLAGLFSAISVMKMIVSILPRPRWRLCKKVCRNLSLSSPMA